MNKRVIIGGAIALAVAVGIIMCFSKFNATKRYNLNDEIKLYVNEKAIVDELEISLLAISDSTCPKGVSCIWQGEYGYALLINGEKVFLGTVTAKEYLYRDYKIVLSSQTSKDYVQFVVTQAEH